MNNAYELTLKFIEVLGDIDSLLDQKRKAPKYMSKVYDDKIDRKEAQMLEIKHKLQDIRV